MSWLYDNGSLPATKYDRVTIPDPQFGVVASDLNTIFTALTDIRLALLGQRVSVRAYGALGDGLTDDTAAIQEALDYVCAQGGILEFPPGTYVFDSTLDVQVDAGGGSPLGVAILGGPGVTLRPSAAVTTALRLGTAANSDGTVNRLIVQGLRLDGVDTNAATGILAGSPAALGGRIVLQDVEVLRFLGTGARGVDVRDVVGIHGQRLYVGRCDTGLYVCGADANLPTLPLFLDCQFRECTTKGVHVAQGYRVAFQACTFESNYGEGLYVVPPGAGAINALWVGCRGCWFENNGRTGTQANNYHLWADGTAGTATIEVRDTNFSSATRAIKFTRVNDFVLDNIWVQSAAHQVVIDALSQGTISNWPANNVTYTAVVDNASDRVHAWVTGADVGSAGLRMNGIWASGTATLGPVVSSGVVSAADAFLGRVGSPESVFLQFNGSGGHGALRDDNAGEILSWSATLVDVKVPMLAVGLDRNVRGYGALGNGSANDTAAFLAAFAAIPSGGRVYVPPGTYVVDTLTVPNWVELYGAGPGVSVLKSRTGTTVLKVDNSGGGDFTHDIRIAHLGILGNGGAGHGLSFEDGTINYNLTVEDVRILSTGGKGLYAPRSFTVRLIDVQVNLAGDHSIEVQGGNTTVLERCLVWEVPANKCGYRIYSGSPVLIACNGVTGNTSPIWGIFGQNVPLDGTANSCFPDFQGCNVEAFTVTGLEFRSNSAPAGWTNSKIDNTHANTMAMNFVDAAGVATGGLVRLAGSFYNSGSWKDGYAIHAVGVPNLMLFGNDDVTAETYWDETYGVPGTLARLRYNYDATSRDMVVEANRLAIQDNLRVASGNLAQLDFDGQTANFVADEVVTGTGGATGIVASQTDAGLTGTLFLYGVTGTFLNNDVLTGSVAGAAVANGTLYGDTVSHTGMGTAVIPAGADSVTVTNSLVRRNSRVFAQLESLDGTLTHVVTAAIGGSFTISGNAVATADVIVHWTLVTPYSRFLT